MTWEEILALLAKADGGAAAGGEGGRRHSGERSGSRFDIIAQRACFGMSPEWATGRVHVARSDHIQNVTNTLSLIRG